MQDTLREEQVNCSALGLNLLKLKVLEAGELWFYLSLSWVILHWLSCSELSYGKSATASCQPGQVSHGKFPHSNPWHLHMRLPEIRQQLYPCSHTLPSALERLNPRCYIALLFRQNQRGHTNCVSLNRWPQRYKNSLLITNCISDFTHFQRQEVLLCIFEEKKLVDFIEGSLHTSF